MRAIPENARRFVALTTVTAFLIALGARSLGPVRAQSISDISTTTQHTFVYTITNPNGPNAIAAYEANGETGELILLGTYPTGGLGNGRLIDSQGPLVVNPEGTLLFAVNPGSDDISVMAIRPDGSLGLVNRPIFSRGVEPASLALRNNLLYVANKGDAANPPSYCGFNVEPDGSLTRVKRRITLAIGDNPTHVLFNHDGSMLIGIRFGSGGLACFSVNPNGRLRFLAELNNQRGSFAGVFSPTDVNHLIVADARLPGASAYLVSEQGSLSQIAALSNAPERAACWIVAHPDGKRVWVSNTGTNSLSLYTTGGEGMLSLSGTQPTAAHGRTPFEIVLDPTNRFLYQLNVGAGNQSINALRVTEGVDGAGLAEIGAIGLAVGSSPIGLVVTLR
jgi:6-phosphogluconolactonase (cycloisomerase 2 family)